METTKGKPLVVVDGYEMIKHTVSRNGAVQYWRCVAHKKGCKARGSSDISSDFIKGNGIGHTCGPPNAASTEVRQRVHEMKKTAKHSTGVHMRDVIRSVRSGISEEASLSLPTDKALLVTMKRHREIEKRQKVDSKTLKDIQFNAFYKTLGTYGNDRFLTWDSREREPGDPVIFMFATDHGLQRLKDTDRWFGDGQFKFIPSGLLQFYTVGVWQHDVLPCVFVFMEDRSEESYRRVFKKLSEIVSGSKPSNFTGDFETASKNAVTSTFPTVEWRGCLFHLEQSIHNYIQAKGLADLYSSIGSKFRSLVQRLIALSLLPIDLVPKAFQNIRSFATEFEQDTYVAAQDLLDHFQINYIYQYKTVPYFLPFTWNCEEAVRKNENRFNDSLESWHNSFQKNFSSSNKPNLSTVIDALQREEHYCRLRLQPLEVDATIQPIAPKRFKMFENVQYSNPISEVIREFYNKPPAERNVDKQLASLDNHLDNVM